MTTGTLQVTCSKLGVSLRRPAFYIGTGLLKRRWLDLKSASSTKSCPRRADTMPEFAAEPKPVQYPKQPEKCRLEGRLRGLRVRNSTIGRQWSPHRMDYGEARSTDLLLDEEMIGQLAVEAEIRGMRIGELVGALILAIVEGDLFQLVGDETYPRQQGPQATPQAPRARRPSVRGLAHAAARKVVLARTAVGSRVRPTRLCVSSIGSRWTGAWLQSRASADKARCPDASVQTGTTRWTVMKVSRAMPESG